MVRAHSSIPEEPLQPRSRCGCAGCSIICGASNVHPSLILRHPFARVAVVLCAAVAMSCSSPTNPGPVVVDLAVQSVSPSTGPATGGTDLTLRGTGFAAGAAVTVGGRAASDVTVRGADTITAKTPASPVAGNVDIVVTSNGRTSTLAGAFRYEVSTNTAPTVKSIVAQGRRVRQPANYADYGETIAVTAVVEDAQTSPAQLKYEWVACGGTFTGTGPQVQWTAPATIGPPSTCTVELIVSDGSRVGTGAVAVRLHDSAREVTNLALLFLEEFADSAIPAETTVRNFSELSNECREGKAAELKEVQSNRLTRIINSHIYGSAVTTINFGGVCAFRSRPADACVATPVEWRSTKIEDGTAELAKGVSFITAVYQSSRWWLCRSEYRPDSGTSLTFMY